jgi:methyl-accepting chemotaxis protein
MVTQARKAANSIRFGVRSKLQIAFGAMALMAVAAAGVGIVSFQATEREFQRVASHDVPMMTDALRMSVMSGEISAAAARFVSARTSEEQRAISSMLSTRSRDLTEIMTRLRASQKDNLSFISVERASERLEQNLKALEKAIVERTELRARLEQKQSAVHQVHSRIADRLGPIVDDSYYEVVSAAEDIGNAGTRATRSFINGGLQRLQAILDVGSEINLATGVLMAGVVTSSPPMLALLEERYSNSAQRVQKLLAKLPNEAEFAPLREQIEALLKLADFKAGAGPQTEKAEDETVPSDTAQAEAAEKDRAERLKNIFHSHESLTGILIKLVNDLNFNLMMSGEEAVKKSAGLLKTLAGRQIAGLRNALETAAQTHMLASLISEGAVVKEPARLIPIQDRFRTATEMLKKASSSIGDPEVAKTIAELVAAGTGDNGMFALRGKELLADQVAIQAVTDNAAIQRDLDKAVAELVAAAEGSMKQSESNLVESLASHRNLLLAVALAAILIAGGIGVFYVQRKLVKPLTAIDASMRRLSSGETELTLPKVSANDEIASMTRAVAVFRDAAVAREGLEHEAQEQRALAEEQRLKASEEQRRNDEERRQHAEMQQQAAQEQASVIDKLADGMRRLSEGDLISRLDDEAFGSYRQICEDFNRMTDRVASTMLVIATSAREVTNSATEISAATTDLSQRTEAQAASLEETSASMVEISETVRKNSENAQHANELAASTRGIASDSGDIVSQAVEAMSRIEGSSKKIADIVGIIDEIARQTNLLALNAAVEAARAGEAGRGFAVVASEVRSLAQRSSQSAKDIKDLITNSGNQVQEGVDLVNRAGQSLDKIVTSIKSVAEIVSDIARASAEQAEGVDQINKALTQMDEATQQNSALVEENAATAKALEQQAAAMNGQLGMFKLDLAVQAPVAEPVAEVPVVAPKLRHQAAPQRPPQRGSNGGPRGPAPRMRSALATALEADRDWQEF